MEYISISWYNIPELAFPVAANQETAEPRVHSGYVDVIISAFSGHHPELINVTEYVSQMTSPKP